MNNKKPVIVAIKEMSAGNEAVGEMWKDTAIFSMDTAISEIVEWAAGNSHHRPLKKQLTITVADPKRESL